MNRFTYGRIAVTSRSRVCCRIHIEVVLAILLFVTVGVNCCYKSKSCVCDGVLEDGNV